MEMKFHRYEDKFRDQVFPHLAPEVYYNKYTTGSLFYKVLKYFRLFKSDLYILEINERAEGCILLRRRFSLWLSGFRWFIYGVAIRSEQRGKGLGSFLLHSCLDYCKASNIGEVFLYVDRDNQNAISLYIKCGFEILAENEANVRLYKKHGNEYLMRRVLN